MKKHGLIALSVAAADQLVKLYVRSTPQGMILFEITGIFSIESCVNTGAAFSVLSGHTRLLAVISILLLAAILIYASRRMNLTPVSWAVLECLAGGGVGNLLDRLFFSGVTDYIRLQFIDFPVFNLADIAITISIAVLMVLLFTDTLEEPVEDKCESDH